MMRKKSLEEKKSNQMVLAMIQSIKAIIPSGVAAVSGHTFDYRESIKVNKEWICQLRKENDLLVNKKTYRAKRNLTRLKPKASYHSRIWCTDMTRL